MKYLFKYKQQENIQACKFHSQIYLFHLSQTRFQ